MKRISFSTKVDDAMVRRTHGKAKWTELLGLDATDGWDAIYEAIAFEAITGGDYTEFCPGGMTVTQAVI